MSLGVRVISIIPMYCSREFPKVRSCPPLLLSIFLIALSGIAIDRVYRAVAMATRTVINATAETSASIYDTAASVVIRVVSDGHNSLSYLAGDIPFPTWQAL